ncbi:MAG: RNA polymerase sigma factor [Ferruginibacter sp.]
MSLEKLIRDVKKADQRAQKALLNLYKKRFLGLCIRYLRNTENAEETMLDGFYKFFKTIQTFHYTNDEGVGAWISSVMINECLVRLRRKVFFIITSENEALDVSEQNTIISKFAVEKILEMVSELPDGYRTVFNLHVLDGYKHEEIAVLLGITEGSSKSQLSKARCLLQKKLLQNGTEYDKRRSK